MIRDAIEMIRDDFEMMVVKLGGIPVVANAMMQHPFNTEVQFRALFAVINLVIPSENLANEDAVNAAAKEELGVPVDVTERDMLAENVGQISNLVVVAMKNFCSSEAIVCLVPQRGVPPQSAVDPNCSQMLEWCIGNYSHDRPGPPTERQGGAAKAAVNPR